MRDRPALPFERKIDAVQGDRLHRQDAVRSDRTLAMGLKPASLFHFPACPGQAASTLLSRFILNPQRGMTRAFQQGKLNLMGSLIGLSERRSAEQAP